MMPGREYHFPTENQRLFDLARRADFPGCGETLVAPAAFIAFYKLAMQRNANGKQDNDDLERLRDLGLLKPDSPDVGEVLGILTGNDPALRSLFHSKLVGLGAH
jgi:hypothetical protein